MAMTADINCDMGESFGLYSFGDDAAIMPFITQANVACGFHGSDPGHMAATVRLAKRHGVRVGAHVALPDLAGFGRREMTMGGEEMEDIVLYQIGALSAFCRREGVELSHLKPHGALYGMAARERHIAEACTRTAKLYGLPILGLSGTLHESVAAEMDVPFQAEFFADLEYDDEGSLIITREHASYDPARAAERARRAVEAGEIVSTGGTLVRTRAETVCIHSDTPNAAAVAAAVHEALAPARAA